MPREGPKEPIDSTWIARVRFQLAENKRDGRSPKDQSELATMIKADKGYVSRLLRGEFDDITYKREIHAAFGWEEPVRVPDGWQNELIRSAESLTPEQLAEVLAGVRLKQEANRRRIELEERTSKAAVEKTSTASAGRERGKRPIRR